MSEISVEKPLMDMLQKKRMQGELLLHVPEQLTSSSESLVSIEVLDDDKGGKNCQGQDALCSVMFTDKFSTGMSFGELRFMCGASETASRLSFAYIGETSVQVS